MPLLFYRSRNIFDYGCFLYDNAVQSELKRLDLITNKCIRLCLGYLKNIPADILSTEYPDSPWISEDNQVYIPNYTYRVQKLWFILVE